VGAITDMLESNYSDTQDPHSD